MPSREIHEAQLLPFATAIVMMDSCWTAPRNDSCAAIVSGGWLYTSPAGSTRWHTCHHCLFFAIGFVTYSVQNASDYSGRDGFLSTILSLHSPRRRKSGVLGTIRNPSDLPGNPIIRNANEPAGEGRCRIATPPHLDWPERQARGHLPRRID